MNSISKSCHHTISFAFIITGAVLVVFNVIGYFRYTTVSVKDIHLEDDLHTTISEEEL
jgi:hypothetical protein